MTKRISWLHLTDLHQGMSNQDFLFPNVQERFYEDLERLHKKCGPWDLVLFTGDLTQKGTKAEFDDLEKTLHGLWEKLKSLGSQPKLLTVPGNHDLQRPDAESPIFIAFSQWQNYPNIREKFWKDKDCDYRKMVSNAFAEYEAWLIRTTIPLLQPQTKGILPGDFAATFKKDDIRLAIVGLNSTFLQLAGGNYFEKLDLSPRQLHEVCDKDAPKWIKSHHAALLMTHQPTTWLSKEAQKHFKSEIAPAGRFHMHLFGHMHESNMTSMSVGGSATERLLQGASLFGMETYDDGRQERIHGYNAGVIEVENDQSVIKIWPRKAINNKVGYYHIAPEHELVLDDNESITSSFKPHIEIDNSVKADATKVDNSQSSEKPKLINNSELTVQEIYQKQFEEMPLDEIPPISQLPKFSRMPLRPNPNFVGREDDFRAIAKALKAGETTSIGQTVAATGMGGVGKTQLACEFAHRYGQYFAGGVFWLSFGNPESIAGEIISCGGTHIHTNFNTLSVSDQLSLVKRSWDDPIPRLLIFDNCEDPKLLTEWRPSTGGCHILITSRRGKWNKSLAVKMVGLGILARESSIELLLRHRPDLATEREALNNIADELGDLPLALNLAGSFLEYFQHSPLGNPKEYLTTLQKSNIDHLSLTGGIDGYSPTKHDLNVARTFQYSYDQLKNDNEIDAIAKGLLKRAAFFACGEPIPRILLKACLKMEHTDNNEFKLERGIYRLIILGLLTESENGDVTLHRLIGLFVHKVDTNAQAQTDVEEIILKVNQELSTQEYTAPILFLLPHIKVVTDNAINREDSLSASLCDSLASHLKCIGYFKPALSYLQHTLTINEKALGPDHPDTAINLNNIGFLFRTLGKYQQAFPYYQRALTIREKILGPDHPDTALSLNNLGGLFFSIGKYQQAILYYQQALSICEKALGPDHPDTAICLNSLVSLFHSIGKYQQAINCAQRTLTINEKVLGLNHPNTALSLNNLGALFRIIGKYQQAINYYQQALDINQKVLGPDHPDTALNLNNLGFLFHSMEEYEKALPYYQRALTINEKFLGPDHPDTAINLNNLGGLFDSMKKYPQALSYYQHALHILKTKLSNNHPYIQTVQRNLEKLKAEMDLAKAQESPP